MSDLESIVDRVEIEALRSSFTILPVWLNGSMKEVHWCHLVMARAVEKLPVPQPLAISR